MTFTHRVYIRGAPGRQLCHLVERLSDGAYYHHGAKDWRAPQGVAGCTRTREEQPGIYAADLPALDPSQNYCIYVLDTDTRQVDLHQWVDGQARPIREDKSRARKWPAPRSASPGGLVFCTRTGRQVELE